MSISRRELLVGVSSLAAGATAVSLPRLIEPQVSLRFAHLTDLHITPGKVPEETVTRAIQHAQEQGAELIINGGDSIFDALSQERDSVNRQWRTFHEVFQQSCSVQVLHVVGNHDIWGWGRPERDPKTKQETLEQLRLQTPYYSREIAGWKIIVLDSIAFDPNLGKGYTAALGEEQYRWLVQELKTNTLPCCVVSHIPILSACAFYDGPNERSGNWMVPGPWMHLDSRQINGLFRQHPQVKLCLSGHIHLIDRVDYFGVSYFCDGSVCGDYWKGAYQGTPPSYALVDLYSDGTFRHQMIALS